MRVSIRILSESLRACKMARTQAAAASPIVVERSELGFDRSLTMIKQHVGHRR
jgi:hypothetical protein